MSFLADGLSRSPRMDHVERLVDLVVRLGVAAEDGRLGEMVEVVFDHGGSAASTPCSCSRSLVASCMLHGLPDLYPFGDSRVCTPARAPLQHELPSIPIAASRYGSMKHGISSLGSDSTTATLRATGRRRVLQGKNGSGYDDQVNKR